MIMLQGTQTDYDAMEGSASKEAPVWRQDELQAMFRFMQKLNEDLAASGEFLEGQGLTAPSQARLVTADDNGRPVVSHDGYGEGREVLAGYWLLECESIERATEIAARVHQCPVPEGTSSHPVIVRPVQEEPPVA
ncbi:YciI family protein [Streptomyces marispadix]|nr:YciI family protein [Streptomyces marispadix]